MSFYIIIRGPLASGKSTVSSKLCEMLGAEHIAIDRVLDDHSLTEDKEEGYISQKSFKKANEIITPKIKDLLDNGKPVVIDGNFYWKSQIDDLIERLNYSHYVFTLSAPVEVCIARDVERGKTHGEDATRVVYKKSTEFTYGIEIDVTQPIEKTTEDILIHLPTKSAPDVLYHGSSRELEGEMLNLSQGEDSEERPANTLFAVYATDLKDTAIVMAMFTCKGVVGGSLDSYEDGKLIARIHGGYPKQEFIYVHHLPGETFKQTEFNKHQFVSFVPVKPIKTEKIRVTDYHHLVRLATKEETVEWIKKYGTKNDKKIYKKGLAKN